LNKCAWSWVRSLIAVGAVLALAGCSSKDNLIGFVPQKFGLTSSYNEGFCSEFLSSQGAFAVGLDQSTLKAIASEGIDFFDDLGPPRGRKTEGIYFADWMETPAPEDGWANNDLQCAMQHDASWPTGLAAALKVSGSYYSKDVNRWAYVVPSLGLIVITMHGR
jgi:hypothetical protein